MKRFTPILYLILLVLSSFSLPGQAFNTASVNQRVALVIGNAEYDAGPLLNPGNDATAMATALRETGFEVMEYLDMPDQAEMKTSFQMSCGKHLTVRPVPKGSSGASE